MTSKSRTKLADQVLGVMSATKAERALRDWANLPGFFRGQRGPLGPLRQSGGMLIRENALARALPVVFGQKPEDAEPALRRMVKRYPEFFLQQGRPMPEKLAFETLVLVAELLRMAWDSQSLRKREWYLADIEGFYHRALDRFGDPPTFALPLEALVYYFRRNSERALHCPNPECPAPYFFSTKKGQKFCTPECAKPSRLESQRRWWNENRGKATEGELRPPSSRAHSRKTTARNSEEKKHAKH